MRPGDTPDKFCKDCRFIQVQSDDYAAATCGHRRLQHPKVDLVTGKILTPTPYLCSYARGQSKLCGLTGRYFLPKE